MKPLVNVIAGRLSRRPTQRRSLEILDRNTETVPRLRQEERGRQAPMWRALGRTLAEVLTP